MLLAILAIVIAPNVNLAPTALRAAYSVVLLLIVLGGASGVAGSAQPQSYIVARGDRRFAPLRSAVKVVDRTCARLC